MCVFVAGTSQCLVTLKVLQKMKDVEGEDARIRVQSALPQVDTYAKISILSRYVKSVVDYYY